MRFAEAAASLNAGKSGMPDGHETMFPADVLSPAALRLLAACDRASVFGGMGSWNDLGFPDPAEAEEYKAVSEALYAAVNTAYLAVANGDHT
ncbi:MAG TPA: hypothetical protein VHG10_04585 [Glycomyces sp.]|nr:hypothetical protein [Glycomyces sp.]